jgi:hypothetical protein
MTAALVTTLLVRLFMCTFLADRLSRVIFVFFGHGFARFANHRFAKGGV